MPSLMAILGLDASRFQQGLAGSKALAQTGGKQIGSALGAGINGALAGLGGLAAIRKTMQYALDVAKQANEAIASGAKMGISGEQFQQYEAMASSFGQFTTTGADVANAFKFIAKSSVEALNGNEEYLESFLRLGVSAKDLKAKSVSQIFDQIAWSLKGAEVNASRVDAVLRTLGRGGADLLPAMQAGAFSRANPFVDPQTSTDTNAQFGKDIGILKSAWGKVWDEVMSPDANKDGAIARLVRWTAKKTREYFGVEEVAGLASPINLKALAKGELEAEKLKTKEEEKQVEKKAKAAAEPKPEARAGLDVNDLQRVGAYVSNPTMDLQRRSERHLSEIRDYLRSIARRADNGSSGGVQF